MTRVVLRSLIIGALSTLSACYGVSSYTGDGRLADNGWRLTSGRYVLDLGPIDISTMGTYSYTLNNLPNAEFVIGIEILELQPNEFLRPDHRAHVRLELKAANGEIIVLEDGRLENWSWGYSFRDVKSFLSRRGEGKDIPLPTGGTRGQRIGFKASGGWGTFFTAEESTAYALTFQVLTPNQLKRPARLMLHSADR